MFTVPNSITVLRLAAAPFIVWLTCSRGTGELAAAAGLFTVAALSDWLDGYLARRMETRSLFGTLLDPVVDKILVLGVLLAFAHLGLLPLWLVLLVALRETAVTVLRQRLSTPARPVGANWMGKAKFCFQVALVELGYACLLLESMHRGMPAAKSLVFWSAIGLTALSYVFLLGFINRERRARAG